MKNTPKDLTFIVKAVKTLTDFHCEQIEYPTDYRNGVSHSASQLASNLICQLYGMNITDGDTVSNYLNLPEDGIVLSEKEITKRLTKYINSKWFKELVQSECKGK